MALIRWRIVERSMRGNAWRSWRAVWSGAQAGAKSEFGSGKAEGIGKGRKENQGEKKIRNAKWKMKDRRLGIGKGMPR
jgi:hypothetical protein